MTIYFDEIYVASTLRELQYRGVKVEPGLTEDELRAVEKAVGTALPPDLALFLRAGLPSGEDFPDWRGEGVSGWPDVDIMLSASLPLDRAVDWEEDPDDHPMPTGHQEAYVSLSPQVMASLSQIRADLSVTYT